MLTELHGRSTRILDVQEGPRAWSIAYGIIYVDTSEMPCAQSLPVLFTER